MIEPTDVWTLSQIKDFIWIPFFTILCAVVAYFFNRHERQDERVNALVQSINGNRREDAEDAVKIRESLLEIKFKLLEIEKSVLSSEEIKSLSDDRLAGFSNSIGEIGNMVDLIRKNFEGHTEKGIRQEEQIKTLFREVERLRGISSDSTK
jgi:hypothetical protein